jgi:hypothetical protein
MGTERDNRLFYHQDGGSTFFRNVGEFLPSTRRCISEESIPHVAIYICSIRIHSLMGLLRFVAEQEERGISGVTENGVKCPSFTLQLQKKQH